MPLTEKDIDQMITEIKKSVDNIVGPIDEGVKDYLIEGLKERLAGQKDIGVVDKVELEFELQNQMVKEVQLCKAEVFDRLYEYFRIIINNLPHEHGVPCEPIKEFKCPICNEYKLTAYPITNGLTSNGRACTVNINFVCEDCKWDAHNIGVFYIYDFIKVNFYGEFNLEDELKKRQINNYRIMYPKKEPENE